jgi:hypothetical protein
LLYDDAHDMGPESLSVIDSNGTTYLYVGGNTSATSHGVTQQVAAVWVGAISGNSVGALTEQFQQPINTTTLSAYSDVPSLAAETIPTLTVGGTVTVAPNAASVTLDGSLSVADSGEPDLASATVSISGFVSGDTLTAASGSGITAAYNFTSGTLILTGIASVAAYQSALDQVTFRSSGTPGTRTINWSVSDGVISSNPATSTIIVHGFPTISVGGTATFTGGGSPVTLDSALSLSDPSSTTLDSATVTIGGYGSGDTLTVGTPGSLGRSFSNGTLTLTGSAGLATYQAALDSITYAFAPSTNDPTGGGTHTSRTVTWQVNDGFASSSAGSSALTIVHAAPTVGASGTVAFIGGGSPVTLDPGLSATAPDSGGTLSSATVTIGNFVSGDTLSVGTLGSLSQTFSNGTLTLTGGASLATYNAALDSVTFGFIPSFGDPTVGQNVTLDAISWQVNDGVTSSATSTSTLDLVHAAPTLTAGADVTFPVGGTPVVLDAGLSLSDPDSGGLLSSATIEVVGGTTSDGDTLATSTTGLPSITATYNPTDEALTLSGPDTLGDYLAALLQATFTSTSTGAGTRTIEWTINDGAASTTQTSTVTIHAAPTVNAGGVNTYNGGQATGALLPFGDVVDPSSATLTSATISIGNFLSGDTLSFVNQNGIVGNYDATAGVLTLTGVATLQLYNQALISISYSFNSQNDPTNGGSDTTRVISWQASDGTLSSAVATSTIDVVHTPLTLSILGNLPIASIGSGPVALTVGVLVNDPDDGGTLNGATVTIAGGLLSGDRLNFTNQNGISGAYAAGVLTLSGTATVAEYQTALESVSYSYVGVDPSQGGSDTNREIVWSATDSFGTTATTTSTLVTLCFLSGTRIATPAGEVAVETLQPGDLVRLADGGTAPVRWMGRNTIARRFSDPVRDWPIRVRAGALAENMPSRDLLLSPGHAVRVGDVLAQAVALVNGTTIVREARVPESFVYWHIELDAHALVLAENTPAESFLDSYQELAFDNRDERPAPPADARELPYPRCKSVRQLPRHVRAALAARAALLDAAMEAAA